MERYSARVVSSSRELTKRESLLMCDTTSAVKLDQVLQSLDDRLVIDPAGWAIIQVDNPKSKGDKQYTRYVIMDESGTTYVTGSESFWEAFTDISSFMEDDPFQIEAFKLPSKNREGQSFITCKIV